MKPVGNISNIYIAKWLALGSIVQLSAIGAYYIILKNIKSHKKAKSEYKRNYHKAVFLMTKKQKAIYLDLLYQFHYHDVKPDKK
jgi:hypothetical protein